LFVIAAAVLFSTGGAAIKGTALSAWQLSAARSFVAAAAILALVPDARRHWQFRFVPVALAYSATMVLFIAATKLTTAANAIFLQDTAPLFVLVTAPLLLHEKIRRSDLVFMAAVACGMALFFAGTEAPHETAPDPRRGNLYAAASAVTWALTITGLRWIERKAPGTSTGMATVAFGNLLTTVIAIPLGLPMRDVRWVDAGVVLWLGVFQVALAYICLTRGIRAVPAFEATTLLLLEPALNPIWAWLVHGETPSSQSLIGGGIIMAATIAKARWQAFAVRTG
jgi:drug/metabolite transporter (DMT)-like permease